MIKFDSLFKLLKRDKKVRSIVGGILTVIVLIVGISVVIISDHYKEVDRQEQILLAQKKEEETKKLEGSGKDLEKIREIISKLIQEESDKLKSINEKITEWEINLSNESIEEALNENYYTGSTTGGSSNSGGSSDGGSSTPTPEPIKGLYEITQSTIDWWKSKGIDIQNMPLGTLFYNSNNDSWSILHLESDYTDYSDLLISQFNGREGIYNASGSFFGYLRSTGEKVRILTQYCD